MAAYQFFTKICRHWEEIHQNANGSYLWGVRIMHDCYFLLYAFMYFELSAKNMYCL